jgi:septum formation protein
MLVLASSSPRRAELLATLGVAFETMTPGVDEDALFADVASPSRRATLLALAKARAVAERRPGVRVLGADTVVVLDGEILGKPTDAADALAMLSRLSGRAHEVVTGLALREADGAEETAFVATAVRFARWPDEALAAYVATAHPLDKAGAYGIQGAAGAFVEHVEGCFFNVVGLPLERVRRLLALARPQSGK